MEAATIDGLAFAGRDDVEWGHVISLKAASPVTVEFLIRWTMARKDPQINVRNGLREIGSPNLSSHSFISTVNSPSAKIHRAAAAAWSSEVGWMMRWCLGNGISCLSQ